VSGACAFGRSRLEILQRSRSANGNLYLVHRDLVRSLCVDPKLLELVEHRGNCRPLRPNSITRTFRRLVADFSNTRQRA